MSVSEAQRIRQKYRVSERAQNKIRARINPFNEGNEEFSLETINCDEVQKFISYCGVEDVPFFVRFYAKNPMPDALVNDVDKDVDGRGGCVEECIVKVFPELAFPRGHPRLTDSSDRSFRHIFKKGGYWHLVMREYFPERDELGKWKTAREYDNAFPRVCGLEDELRDNVVYGTDSKRDCDDDGVKRAELYRRSRRLNPDGGGAFNPDVDFNADFIFGEAPAEDGGGAVENIRVGTRVSSIAERVRLRAQRRKEREDRMNSLRSSRRKKR